MFGICFIKLQFIVYLMQFCVGKVVCEGLGLLFFYYGLMIMLVVVLVVSQDCLFILELVMVDFQSVIVQGQVMYCISDLCCIVVMMDFLFVKNGQSYVFEDLIWLGDCVVQQVEVIVQQVVQVMELKVVLCVLVVIVCIV